MARGRDWLVCPYRALDPDLMREVVRRLYAAGTGRRVLVVPAPTLGLDAVRSDVVRQARDGALVVVYLQNKLGGEISIGATDRSPEVSFDITFVELSPAGSGNVGIGRFGVLEVQTMDFHGSYRRAVKNLQDALRLHEEDFADVLQKNQRWLSDRIEGPNIANVFKRTFYQMMLKFQLGMHPRSVGAAFAVPQAVWDSWQPHLGRPDLVPQEDGTHVLVHDAGDGGARTWIYVFDLDANAGTNPSPVVVKYTIATDAAAIAQCALQEVPRHAFSEAGAGATLVEAIHRRLSAWWPELALPPARRVESGEGAPPGRRQARGEG